eukprot:GEMP01046833.1.p1 GENE.GEMP01046833.1~~GEMP01046833.1.p1  ORF type:complete len:340 (+),score=53.66 GEMP01046833.1:55-1020(+)
MLLAALVVVFTASLETFTVPTVALHGTLGMPIAGLGMCCRETAKGEAAERAIKDYLLMGGRLIDTAVLYENHVDIARGIAQSGVPREDIFVTTKVWPNDFGFERTYEVVIRSLKELGLDYADLVLLHAPGIMNGSMDDPKNPPCLRQQDGFPNWSMCRKSAWAALSNLKRSGHIRAIGVSNFGKRQIEELIADAHFPVQVNQIESHPWYPNQDIIEYCQANGIIVTAYASLGSRKMAKQLLDDESLKSIGVPNGKTSSQILLRWAVQRNVTVIPGTSNPEHMRENLGIFDFDLDSFAMDWLSGVPPEQYASFYGHIPDSIL